MKRAPDIDGKHALVIAFPKDQNVHLESVISVLVAKDIYVCKSESTNTHHVIEVQHATNKHPRAILLSTYPGFVLETFTGLFFDEVVANHARPPRGQRVPSFQLSIGPDSIEIGVRAYEGAENKERDKVVVKVYGERVSDFSKLYTAFDANGLEILQKWKQRGPPMIIILEVALYATRATQSLLRAFENIGKSHPNAIDVCLNQRFEDSIADHEVLAYNGKVLGLEDLEGSIRGLQNKVKRFDRLIASAEARIKQLEQLPTVFKQMTQDSWLCIFKHTSSYMDIFNCSKVCRIWRATVHKYQGVLPSCSNEFFVACNAMDVDGRSIPLGLRCSKNKPYIVMQLLPAAPLYALGILRSFLRNETKPIAFVGHVTSPEPTYKDELLGVVFSLQLVDGIPYPYARLEFMGKQLLNWLPILKTLGISAKVGPRVAGKFEVDMVALLKYEIEQAEKKSMEQID